jgi:hypothetical protein
MKPSEWEPSTGLVSLKYAGEPKTAKTKTPPGLETGLDASDNIHVSSEGRGRIFFLTSPFIGRLQRIGQRIFFGFARIP